MRTRLPGYLRGTSSPNWAWYGMAGYSDERFLTRYCTPRYADVVARAIQNAVRRALPAPSHPLELPRVIAR